MEVVGKFSHRKLCLLRVHSIWCARMTLFIVYEDFMNYKSGVYRHQSGGMLGGHAVKIVGWGKDDNGEHWIVQNSWTTNWGDKGFFKIAMGQCNIDSGAVSVMPSL